MTSHEMQAPVADGTPAMAPVMDRGIPWFRIVPFWGVHVAAVAGVLYYGLSWRGAALALATYFLRIFAITAGYHRYFSHRTYRTSRFFQFVLAFLSQTSSQKGVLWWAAHHRQHHKRSDLPGDVHSYKLDGFYWSHVGWVLARGTEDTNFDAVKDLSRFPELRFLNKYWVLPVVVLGAALVAYGGFEALVWGLFVSTVVLWHATFSINSLAHKFGSRRYVTTDDSKNGLLLALLTFGEGWHNNHHYYPRAANQGFYWWEIDVTFYILKVLSWIGVVWDLHTPSERVLRANRIADRTKTGADDSGPVGLALPSPADAE